VPSSTARAKDTSRAEARRRHREELRATAAVEPNVLSDQVTPSAAASPAPTAARPRIGMPDVRGDLAALPGMLRRKPTILIPFGLFLLGFGIDYGIRVGALVDSDMPGSIAVLAWQFLYLPIPFIVFAAGGFLAPRGAWLIGLLLGLQYAILVTISSAIPPAEGVAPGLVVDISGVILEFWAMSILVGILSGALGAWYAGFLRSSQQRAAAARLAREQERAAKAREQARLEKEEARKARSAGRSTSTQTPSSGR
jgi:uncharacterized membrane protein